MLVSAEQSCTYDIGMNGPWPGIALSTAKTPTAAVVVRLRVKSMNNFIFCSIVPSVGIVTQRIVPSRCSWAMARSHAAF